MNNIGKLQNTIISEILKEFPNATEKIFKNFSSMHLTDQGFVYYSVLHQPYTFQMNICKAKFYAQLASFDKPYRLNKTKLTVFDKDSVAFLKLSEGNIEQFLKFITK